MPKLENLGFLRAELQLGAPVHGVPVGRRLCLHMVSQ